VKCFLLIIDLIIFSALVLTLFYILSGWLYTILMYYLQQISIYRILIPRLNCQKGAISDARAWWILFPRLKAEQQTSKQASCVSKPPIIPKDSKCSSLRASQSAHRIAIRYVCVCAWPWRVGHVSVCSIPFVLLILLRIMHTYVPNTLPFGSFCFKRARTYILCTER
jgi:hypothetical protein